MLGFFRNFFEKKNLTFLKYNEKSVQLNAIFFSEKTHFFRIVFIKDLTKKMFWNQFGPWEVPKLEKLALSLSCIVWFEHVLRSKINLESSFQIKCNKITICNFLLLFCFKKMLIQKLFPILFSKWDMTKIGSLYWRKKFWKGQTSQNMPKI